MDICYSGGAKGADTLFGDCAKRSKHEVVHFAFQGMAYEKNVPFYYNGGTLKTVIQWNYELGKDIKLLSAIELLEGNDSLKEANKWLKRSYPTSSVYTNCLLQRNYHQIKDSERIYAIGSLDVNGIPFGGTAWAVMMGILKGIKEIYFFDQLKNQWYQFQCRYEKTKQLYWEQGDHITPTEPYGRYTGIGTRELTDDGKQAIKALYV